ncbi:SLC13 family permease [Cohnella sp. AR92]|uniref:SLC13 family permease n=1 Tax=Cohnella sp. AR92 TaxID=648716 RepID=UPI000F8F2A5A|nr:SLC13 family permease [Cohnella sp. AR92]RUS49065.1 cyclic nucleotide-binding domain-containing protein [Cohnella sp. AR92]
MDLSRIEMFNGLSKVELARILGMLDRRAEKAGAILFRQGELGDSMYLIEKGQVQLYSETPDGGRQPLVLLGEGVVFGEMALLTGEPRSAMAVAATDLSLYRIDSEIFQKLIRENSLLSAYFIRLLSQRLVQTNDRLQASKEAKARLVRESVERLPEPLPEALSACAMLPLVDERMLEALFSFSWEETSAKLREQLSEFVRHTASEENNLTGEGRIELHASVKPILAERYMERHSERERERWLRQAAEYWMEQGRWDAAAAVYAERDDWETALDIAERRLSAAETEQEAVLNRAARGEAPGSTADTKERHSRSHRSDRTAHPDRSERATHSDRPDHVHQAHRADRSDSETHADRPDQAHHVHHADVPDHAHHADRSNRARRPGHPERPEHADSPELPAGKSLLDTDAALSAAETAAAVSAAADTAEARDAAGFTLFDRCPADKLLARFRVLAAYLSHCAAHKREIGVAKLEELLERGAASFHTDEEKIRLLELGAEWSRALGHKQKALVYLQRAERIATHAEQAGAEDDLSERSYRLAEQKLRQEKSKDLAAKAGGLWKRKGWSAAFASCAAIGSMAGFHFMAPVAGLSRDGMDFIGIGLAAVIFWMVNVVADYLVALVMAMLWVLEGLLTPETALSGFASTTWLYMLFILAVGAAIARSGILYRLSLHALRRFPANYRGQLWGLIAGGIVLNPLIPSSSAKVTLGVPIARTLSESMGFRDRSPGTAGLSLAAMVFYGFTAPFILTGSYTNAMAFGLVPGGAKAPSWFEWFLYALPAFLVFACLMLLLLKRMFRSPAASRPIVRETVDEQLNLLGRWTKEERWTSLTVIGCMLLLILQPLHGLDNAWVMLLGFGVLLITGALDTQTLKTSVDWPFLLFIGIAFSFAKGAEELGIIDAMTSVLSSRMDAFLSSPVLFLGAVMVISFLVTLVVRDDPAVILLVIALLPLADQAGIHPWVLIFTILLATDPFFFTFQSPTYLLAYYSAEGKSFSHRQGQIVAIGYAAAVIVAVLASVPYWEWIGLIR